VREARALERAAWALLALAVPLQTLLRIQPFDVPWHLATARLAETLGHWPTENTFSFTFPHHPIYQQYPVFQRLLYAIFRLGSWEALSVFIAVGYTAILVLFLRWGGGLRRAALFHLPWMLVVVSFHTRAAARPDILSLLFLATLLLLIDAYRGGRRLAMLAVPALHWLWVNGHQLFPFSFVVQGLFLAHLVLVRLPLPFLDRADRALPLWPPLAALAASAGLTLLGPLGPRVVEVLAHTAGSLASHRGDVEELARLWTEPVWLALALLMAAAVLVALVRGRRALNAFEVGVWLFGCALAVSAVRGLVYYMLISAAVLQRTLLRQPPAPPAVSPFLRRTFRALAAAATFVLLLTVAKNRLLARSYGQTVIQLGVGRTVGNWPDAAIARLRADPPPGPMMNLPWSLANALIWYWPERKVFVDPRFESYPRDFLVDALRSVHDDAVLDRVLGEHGIQWILGEHCGSPAAGRLAPLLASGEWQPVYADSLVVALVRRSAATEGYRAAHAFAPSPDPPDLASGPPALRARQRGCYQEIVRLCRRAPGGGPH
jgi:hypothetical protein